MSNSHGRGRPEFPPQPVNPDHRQPNPNRFPAQQPQDHWQGQQTEPWPSQEPATPHQDWTQPGGFPAAGGQHGDPGHGQHQPVQQGYAPPEGYADPNAHPAQQPGEAQQPAHWPQSDGQANGYHQQAAPQQPVPQQPAPQPDPYRHPNEPAAVAEDPYSQPTLSARLNRAQHPGDAGHQTSPYAAQFEAYVPPQRPAEPAAAPPPAVDPFAASHAEPALRGANYDDWPAGAQSEQNEPTLPPQGYSDNSADPRFAAAEARHQQYYQQQHQQPQSFEGSQDWTGQPQPGAVEQGYSEGGYAYPGAAPQEPGFGQADSPSWQQPEYADYDQQPTGAPDPYAQPIDPSLAAEGQHVAVGDGYEDYEDEDDDEQGSGVSRMVMVAAALVGAIVIGAGLAFGYKTFFGSDTKIAAGPPVVSANGQAGKVRPGDPGGRKFGHTNSKMLGKISNQGRSGAKTNPDGSRRVSTLQIGRDGKVYNQGAAPLPSSNAPQNPVVSVPGLTVVDGFAGQRAAAQRARQAVAGRQPIVVKPPKVPANALSPVRSAIPKTPSKPPVAIAKPALPKKPVAKRAPTQPAPKARAPVAPRSSSGAGYVAVLASVPVSGTSRLDALKTFADIQQNYGSVLGKRTPDVREANLGSKGRYHRLMVGPPASRESANALCKKLKSAGYPSCWITAY